KPSAPQAGRPAPSSGRFWILDFGYFGFWVVGLGDSTPETLDWELEIRNSELESPNRNLPSYAPGHFTVFQLQTGSESPSPNLIPRLGITEHGCTFLQARYSSACSWPFGCDWQKAAASSRRADSELAVSPRPKAAAGAGESFSPLCCYSRSQAG